MNYRRKQDPAVAEAAADHRRREDAAPRLRDAAPKLQSLRLKIEEIRAEGRVTAMSYVRPIVVATAPAHFEFRCTEPKCDGRHDLTVPILRALRQSLGSCTGESSCSGIIGSVLCDRTLAYVAEATYLA
jgi:hypothetical protein